VLARVLTLVSLVAALASVGVPARAADDPPAVTRSSRPPATPTVEATGEGVVMVPPDQALLSLGVATEGPSAQDAMEQNARRTTAVLQALAAAGFGGSAVFTQAIRLAPVFEPRPPPNQPPRIVGYRATNQVQVKTPRPATIGQALDAAVGAGANAAANLAFGLADPQAAQLRALRLAAEDAQRRATAVADALGKKISRIVELRTLDLGLPEPAMLEGVRALSAAAPPTPVEPGQITVRARVFIRAEFE
jgi:hypothetical protein